jgi:hypothetical protein
MHIDIYTNLAVSLLIILIISSVRQLLKIKSMGATHPVIEITELDYLYSYRNALLKVLQIESELEGAAYSTDYYTSQRNTLFSPIETRYIKQDVKQKTEQLKWHYEQGKCSLPEFHIQLDGMLRQLDILIFKSAV